MRESINRLSGSRFLKKSVDIGDQLSQIIGIYYPNKIDTYVKYVRSQKYYGRYMDDWYVMSRSKEELVDLLNNITRIASELGIHINQKKTRIVKISASFKFLQIKYTLTSDGKVIKRINPKRVTAMRKKLKSLSKKVDSGEIKYEETVENMFKGWMGNHYKIMSKVQRAQMIDLFEKLFRKNVVIQKHKLIITEAV